MLSYLAQRLPDPGFLFLFHDGMPLSWDCRCQELRLALELMSEGTADQSDSHPDVWSLEVGSIPGLYSHRSVISYHHFIS